MITILVAFGVFLPALSNELVNFDDLENLVQNTQFRGLGWDQLRWMFTTFHLGPYQPLSWITFGLDWVVWGGKPVGYHLTNLLLHGSAALAFYFLSLRLIRRARPLCDEAVLRMGAAAAAMLFAIHPLRVESVAWATERRDVLSGLLYFATLIAYLRYVERWESRAPRGRRYALVLVLFAMCLLSKAMGMTMPLALLILDIYPLRRLRGAGWSMLVMEKLPLFALAAGAAIAAIVGQRQAGAFQSFERYGLFDRIGIAAYASCFYLVKSVAPFRLAPMYEIPRPLNPLQPYFLASFGAVLGISALAVVLRRRWPGFLAAWAFFLVTLGPVSGLAHAGRQIAADRYSYLPMAGFAVLAGGGVVWGLSGSRRRATVALVAAGGTAMGLSFLSVRQSLIWRDSIRLWNRVLEIDPQSATAHMNLAVQLHSIGQNESALPHAIQAALRRPDDSDCQFVYGRVLRGLGREAEAFDHFRIAALAAKSSPEAQAEYGIALARRGDLQGAAPFLKRSTDEMPALVEAQMTLGLIEAGRGNGTAMRACFERAIAGKGLTADSVRVMAVASERVLGRAAAAEMVRKAQIAAVKAGDRMLEAACGELLAGLKPQ